MRKIVMIVCVAILAASCGNNEAEEKAKKFELEKLERFIKQYSDAADEVCKCLAENKGEECDKLFESMLSFREIIDAPLLNCLTKKYMSAEEYAKVDDRISAITERTSICIKDGPESPTPSADTQKDPPNAKNTTEEKAPKKEEEHHHTTEKKTTDPY